VPDVSFIRRTILEGMDLRRYGIRPVLISEDVYLWGIDGRPELCLDVDDALATVGLCAVWKDGTIAGGLCIEHKAAGV